MTKMIWSPARFVKDKYFLILQMKKKMLASFTYHGIAILHLLTSFNCLSDVGTVGRGSVVKLCLLH
jgi:hypothetical protein